MLNSISCYDSAPLSRKRLLSLLILTASFGFAVPEARAQLVVASFGTNDTRRYDQVTGAFLGVFTSGGGLDHPTGVLIGPDGNLYVGSAFTNQVKRFNRTTGAFIDNFASGGGLDAPNGMSFGPDGNLYVG